ncbi:hypothetical protein PISL3812_08759 [Talaromyces islandicus]|uniref:Uncharacterized protein n=1 Tax=Talaromyces islandicus TaxID=28573 RepID=A0A0U1M852_TALIS|nr:hypothetical protein PISL3812_08759 [Talaromyces islandicus]
MEFKPRFPVAKSMPNCNAIEAGKRRVSPIVLLRDQLPISTWLLLGASVHGALSLLLPQSGIYISGVVFLVLALRTVKALLQAYGILHNPEIDHAVLGKVSAQIPDPEGNMPTQPSQEGVVVMMLGIKSNHPLGSFAPGFQKIGKAFGDMLKVLDSPEGREKYGFLNLSSYVGTEASASNEIMTISYWRNIEGIHEFAHSPVHREIWDWWNRTEKQHPYISIMHELYRANGLSGAHENIYINCRPTLLGGSAYPIKATNDKEDSEVAWRNPLVEAKKGVLASSDGRLGKKSKYYH